jgi:hypothetical protein
VTVAGAGAVVSAENRRTVTVRRCGVDEMSVWDAAQVGGAGSERIQGFLSELEHFVAAVGGGEPLATMNDAAEALRLAERVGGNTGEMMDMG